MMEWLPQPESEYGVWYTWVFGEKIRGVIRSPLARITISKMRAVPFRIELLIRVYHEPERVEFPTFIEAVEAAEKAMMDNHVKPEYFTSPTQDYYHARS